MFAASPSYGLSLNVNRGSRDGKVVYLIFQDLGPRQHNVLDGPLLSYRPETTATGAGTYSNMTIDAAVAFTDLSLANNNGFGPRPHDSVDGAPGYYHQNTAMNGAEAYRNMTIRPAQTWIVEPEMGTSMESQLENNAFVTTGYSATVAFTGPSLANNNGFGPRPHDSVDGAPGYYHQNTAMNGIETYPSTHSVLAHPGLPETFGLGPPAESVSQSAQNQIASMHVSTQRQHPNPPAAAHPRELRIIPQTEYSPKNQSKDFKRVPVIKFNMVDGSKGMPLAAIGEREFTGLVGCDDPVFESLKTLPEKMGYRLQLVGGPPSSPVHKNISRNFRGQRVSVTRATVAEHVLDAVIHSGYFSEDDLSKLVLLRVKRVSKGTLQPVLAYPY